MDIKKLTKILGAILITIGEDGVPQIAWSLTAEEDPLTSKTPRITRLTASLADNPLPGMFEALVDAYNNQAIDEQTIKPKRQRKPQVEEQPQPAPPDPEDDIDVEDLAVEDPQEVNGPDHSTETSGGVTAAQPEEERGQEAGASDSEPDENASVEAQLSMDDLF